MWPIIKRFFTDETAGKRGIRALAVFVGIAWNFWQIEGSLTWQGIGGALMAAIAVSIGVGEPNPKPKPDV